MCRTFSSEARAASARVLLTALLAGGLLSCNDYPLRHLQDSVLIQRSDIYAQGRRTEIDVLWVVDNSSSMCEEQASLSAHFDTFIEGLAGLEASFHVAVVATEVDPKRPTVAGHFRYAPARSNSQHCVNYVACTDDQHCGVGGCLCGLPWLRRCQAAAECEDGERCLAEPLPGGGESSLRYCSAPCTEDKDCQDISSSIRTLTCQEGSCRVISCTSDADCGGSKVCLPVEADQGALSVCRRFREPGIECRPGTVGPPCPLDTACTAEGRCEPVGFCPPQTCDCPKTLDPIMGFGTAESAEGSEHEPLSSEELRHRFRCMALLGTDGDTYEKGLEAAERALTPPLAAEGGPNDGFLRPGAFLVVVFLSDENDCSDRGDECRTEADCPDPENSRCREDPVEPDKSFCRLPQRETQECEYWGNRLMDPHRLAATFKDLKLQDGDLSDKACSVDTDCEGLQGYYCSPEHERCARDNGRVIVAGIVGDRDLFCAEACPTADNRDCVPSEACKTACAAGTFCAERVYKQGVREVAPTCLDPTFGSAYSGARYHEFVEDFLDRGITQSICQGRIDEALSRIAGLVADVIPDSFCLAWPLPLCTTDDECRGDARCITDEAVLAGSSPFCALETLGPGGTPELHPADLLVEIRPLDASEPRTLSPADWVFYPGEFGGCVEFRGAGPGPEESLFLRYITPLDPDVPLAK